MSTIAKEEFEEYLKSINGLVPGYFPDREPITSRYFFDIDEGWLGLVKDLIEELISTGWNKKICQVKEKFGSLRFYPGGCTDEQWKIITKYEGLSYEICESCGASGAYQNNTGWIYTRCKSCWKEMEDRNNKLIQGSNG